jgi:transcriptional regulator with XRE-family HTH domain
MSPVNVSSIGSYIREQREQAKISIRQLAQAAGVSNPYLSQVERGLRRPSADILQQIAKGLRISAEALYVQAGILDDKPGETSVTDAIMADPELTERQKQMLLDIYESFRKEVRAEAESQEPEPEPGEPGPEPGEPGEAGEPGSEPATDDEAHQLAHAKVEAIADVEPDVKADPEIEAEAEAAAEAEVGAWSDLDPGDPSETSPPAASSSR